MVAVGHAEGSWRSATRAAATRLLTKVAWSWAGVPSGPLGWVSSHWVMPRLHARIYPVLAQELDLRPEDDLLEVACGGGVFLASHAQQVHHVAGLDLSGIQVGLARQRLANRIAAGTAEIIQGDAAALPWRDGTFSVVTCMGSFEAFPEPERVLAEMVRVLRPGGRAVLDIGEQVPPGTQTHQVLGAIWVWSEDDVRRMVEEAGLSDVQMSYASSSSNGRAKRMSSTFGADLRLVHGLKASQAAGRREVP